MEFLTHIIRFLAPLAFLMPANGCGSSSAELSNALQDLQGAASTFEGVTEAVAQPDKSWVIRWDSAGANGVIYGVYSTAKGDPYDFLSPIVTTYETMYRFYNDDLLNASPRCFVVRMLNGGFDENTNEVCTDDQPIKFEGIGNLSRLNNGRYVAEWADIAIPGLVYMVFERKQSSEFDFSQPSYGGIRENFFRTNLLPRGEVYCYAIRYYHPELSEDENENERCTVAEEKITFGGISSIQEVNQTTVRVSWDIPTDNDEISGYQVFVGSDFSELIASAEVDESVVEITGLAAGRQYSFGVSAVDAYGRKDDNLKILSIVMSAGSEEE